MPVHDQWDIVTTLNNMKVPQKLKLKLLHDPTIPLLGTDPKEWRQGHVSAYWFLLQHYLQYRKDENNSIDKTHKSQQNVIHTYNGLLFSPKKEGNFYTNNTKETWMHYAKWHKPSTKGKICRMPHKVPSQIHWDRKQDGGCQRMRDPALGEVDI